MTGLGSGLGLGLGFVLGFVQVPHDGDRAARFTTKGSASSPLTGAARVTSGSSR